MQQSVDCESLTPTRGAKQQSVDCESLTPTRGATQQSVDCESLTPTRGATQQSVNCESLTPTRGATQQSVDCESLTPTRGGHTTKHSRGSPTKGSKIRRGCLSGPKEAFSGIPNIGEQNQKWLPHPYLFGGPKEGGSAMSPLRSQGSPTEGDGNKSGPQKGGSATSPLRSRESPNKGTKSKVAHKWADVLSNPYVFGGP